MGRRTTKIPIARPDIEPRLLDFTKDPEVVGRGTAELRIPLLGRGYRIVPYPVKNPRELRIFLGTNLYPERGGSLHLA